jgi:hypothetical protein
VHNRIEIPRTLKFCPASITFQGSEQQELSQRKEFGEEV